MVLRDGNAYLEKPETPCRKDYYKIMSVLAPNADYHFYRQNNHLMVHGTSVAGVAKKYGVSQKNVTKLPLSTRYLVKDANLWSHKRGLSTGPLLVDSNGKTISDPRRAARDYGDLNYREYCQTFCVHKTQGQNYRNLVETQFQLSK